MNCQQKVKNRYVTVSLIQDGDRSVPLQNYFSYFYSKSVFKPRNFKNLN